MDISRILDEKPIINEWVLQDLVDDKVTADTGADDTLIVYQGTDEHLPTKRIYARLIDHQ